MYVNKCTKCGAEFETKNPKRVICPNCLYADKKTGSEAEGTEGQEKEKQTFSSYSTESFQPRNDDRPRYNQYDRPQRPFDRNDGGYNRPPQGGGYNNQGQGGYQRPQGGYNRPQGGGYNNQGQGGYQRPQGGGYNNQGQGGYNRPQGGGYNNQGQGGYNRPQGGGYNNQGQGGYNRPQGGGYAPRPGGFNRPQGGGFAPRPGGFRPGGGRPPQRPPKQLLVDREQLAQIEELYKKMLPLPNPDAHEVIGEQIQLEGRKVFFGINLIRQKMMLPKLPYPKRKLAVSPDQLLAIKTLYEPLLPLPPIGCHKIISAQLKIDEWRVHVGIGLVRKQMGLDRWNPDRKDAPKEFKKTAKKATKKTAAEPKEPKEPKAPKATKKTKEEKAEAVPEVVATEVVEVVEVVENNTAENE